MDGDGTARGTARSFVMIKAKPPSPQADAQSSAKDNAKNTATKQIAENAVKGGPKSVKKDKRMGIGKR
jgi:hypothetical protein